MEIGLRAIAAVLYLLKWLLYPVYLWRSYKKTRVLPLLDDPLLKISATQLAEGIRNGKISSEKIVQAYVRRIKDVNLILNAVVDERFDAAIEDAKRVDRYITEHPHLKEELKTHKPLLGVPVTIKESCCVKGLSYSVGSLTRLGLKAESDGKAVTRLKAAGAIPLLVSNTPEFCLSWESNNLITGATCNPYNSNYSSGGSSGGEGALLGAAASVIGLGSDIAGSIRIPAMFNGVFGHKPTPGIVPLNGHCPTVEDKNFPFYLTMGPLTRYAEDLTTMMNVLGGENAEKLKLNEKVDLSKLDVYYMTDLGFSLVIISVQNEIKDTIHTVIKHLEKNCGSTIKNVKFEEMEDSLEICTSLFFGMKNIFGVIEDLDYTKGTYKLFSEMVKGIFGLSKYTLNATSLLLATTCNGGIPQKHFEKYWIQRQALREKIMTTLGKTGILLYPTFPTSALRHGQIYSHISGIVYTMIFNVLGFPSVHVPLGLDNNNMPIGLQVVATPYQDRLCLAVAVELEKHFGGWKIAQY